jgi:hypothetical protein
LRIFISTGSLTDKKYTGVWVAFAGHCISSQGAQTAFAAFANFIGNFLKLFGCAGNRGIVLPLLFGLRGFGLGGKAAGKKVIHLNVLPNDFVYVCIFFHRGKL